MLGLLLLPAVATPATPALLLPGLGPSRSNDNWRCQGERWRCHGQRVGGLWAAVAGEGAWGSEGAAVPVLAPPGWSA